jgi:protein-S-isoprenylcysteine O-methyltransferase Ste14
MLAFYHHSITVLWLAWAIYWCIAAIGAKPTRRRESVTSRLGHLLPMFLGVGLLISPHLTGDWLAARFLPRSTGWFWLGFCLVVLGLGFSVAARAWLGGNWSGTVTLKQDHELIRRGPYRWVRHPIYTGILLALLGSVIARGEWRGLVGLALITGSLLRKIAIEERFLTQQFGDAYTRYRREVPALIPRPPLRTV